MKRTDGQISLGMIWKSKLALSLIPIFMLVVSVPLAVTVLVVGHVGQQQIVATAQMMQRSNLDTVEDAGQRFQKLGQEALGHSSIKIANICLSANRSMSNQSEKDQAASIAASGKDFAEVTQSSFDGAMHESLLSNKQILAGIGGQMDTLFAGSAHYTQSKVDDRVQSAILVQINGQMSERASQLAESFDSYIQTNVNYLGLTAQMLNLYENNPTGQKAVLDALVRRFPMMFEVSVLDQAGRETVMSAANRVVLPSDLIDQSFTPYYKAGIDDRTYVGIDSFPTDGGAPVLRLAVPVELYRGKAVGVLSAALSLNDLWDMIRNAHFGKSEYAFVEDGKGYPFLIPRHVFGAVLEQSAAIKSTGWTLVVEQPQSEVMQPIQSFKNDISGNTQRSLAQMHSDIKRASSLATEKLLSNAANLHLAATRSLQVRTAQMLRQLNNKTEVKALRERAEMQDAISSQITLEQVKTNGEMVKSAKQSAASLEHRIPAMTARALNLADRRLGFYAIIILTVSCGLSCLIGLLLAGTLVRPIVRLSQGTRSLALGELDKRVDERAPAEIGDLAIAFNSMAASLQQSRADLTDAESQLVQSAKLASLGTLSAGVAHELNQPVAIVRGLAQQLKVDSAIPADVREDLEIIEKQTGRMMKIITHLRTFCRTGGYEMVPTNVNQVILDCFILIDAQLKSHGVAVEMDLCEAVPVVLGDANELEQVFINLITNARDAMDGIPNACLSICSKVDGNRVVLEFKDNGLGISDANAEHIFDPFFTTKEVGKGTGLGLSISHGLIQKHSGSITARNDDGAVFTITLPVVESERVQLHQLGTAGLTKQAA